MSYIATVDGTEFEIEVERPGSIVVRDAVRMVDLRPIDGRFLYSLLLDNQSYDVFVERRGGVYYVSMAGNRYAVEVEDARMKRLKEMGGVKHEPPSSTPITAPMPGLVVRVLARPGQSVACGDGLVILEAMKMENEVTSPRHGVVTEVHVTEGMTVNGGDPLALIVAAGSGGP